MPATEAEFVSKYIKAYGCPTKDKQHFQALRKLYCDKYNLDWGRFDYKQYEYAMYEISKTEIDWESYHALRKLNKSIRNHTTQECNASITIKKIIY